MLTHGTLSDQWQTVHVFELWKVFDDISQPQFDDTMVFKPPRAWNSGNTFRSLIPTLFRIKGGLSEEDRRELFSLHGQQWAKIMDVYNKEITDKDASEITSYGAYLKKIQGLMKERSIPLGFGTTLSDGNVDNMSSWLQYVTDTWDTTGAQMRKGRGGADRSGEMVANVLDHAQALPDPNTNEAYTGKKRMLNGVVIAQGNVVPGMGVVTNMGGFSRGITQNAAGADLDTQVEGVEGAGDRIAVGPLSVDTATRDLRPSFVIAGGEEVRPDYEENLQSDALFEAFSWVPDGYGLGPSNSLHLQNKQNDAFRFGMEEMCQPRRMEEHGFTHEPPLAWADALPIPTTIEFMKQHYGNMYLGQQSAPYLVQNPIHVLDDDYRRQSSFKELPRQVYGPSPMELVVHNEQQYMQAYDPPGAVMSHFGYQDIYSGTWNDRREHTLGRL